MKKLSLIRISAAIALFALSGCSRPVTTPGSSFGNCNKCHNVEQIARGGQFSIEVNRAQPMRGRNIDLNSLYTLRVAPDSVYSHLPYYGRAYNVPYGGGQGLNFDSFLSDYRVSSGRKNSVVVRFSTRSEDDVFSYRVEMYPNGAAYITVVPVNRETINFTGYIR